ncbi:hypothetical protein [Streptococcus pneumoniae]|uniref:hypothetical protein n=1 Tax=Streptococcus pneumoniae TaxID=1313 RepID=UPI001C7FEB0D|nr:hypothetical protein [Streptococcus pneumoniae]MBX4470407.1 hypothetical protein [Streptococcus pneumoniae]
MKDYIIAFFVVLAISCFLNGGGVAENLTVGVAGVADAKSGTRRADGQIPEINYIDADSKAPQITQIEDTDRRESSHSQNGSNF